MAQESNPENHEINDEQITPNKLDLLSGLGEYIILSPQDQEKLIELLLNPPEFNEALLRAMESHERLFRKQEKEE